MHLMYQNENLYMFVLVFRLFSIVTYVAAVNHISQIAHMCEDSKKANKRTYTLVNASKSMNEFNSTLSQMLLVLLN